MVEGVIGVMQMDAVLGYGARLDIGVRQIKGSFQNVFFKRAGVPS